MTEWISVKDRLPNEEDLKNYGENLLCRFKGKNYFNENYYGIGVFYFKRWDNEFIYYFDLRKDWLEEGFYILMYADRNHTPYLISKSMNLNTLLTKALSTLSTLKTENKIMY